MSHIFLSYTTADRERVRPLVALLEPIAPVWWDQRIMHGDSWDEAIEQALDEAACVVVAWTEKSVDARWVKAEARYALKHRILIPVRLDPVDVPIEFSDVETALLEGWDGSPRHPEAAMLKDSVAAVIARGRGPTIMPPPPPQPSRTSRLRRLRLAVWAGGAAVLGAAAIGGARLYRHRGDGGDTPRRTIAADPAAPSRTGSAPPATGTEPGAPRFRVDGIIISETATGSMKQTLAMLNYRSADSVGYHYLVDVDGRVYSYFDESRRAGHTPHLNGTRLGIGMVHVSQADARYLNIPYRAYTPGQIDGLVALLATLAHDHHLNVQSIRSREEVDPTKRREITAQMNDIRQRVGALLAEWRLNGERPAAARVRAAATPGS